MAKGITFSKRPTSGRLSKYSKKPIAVYQTGGEVLVGYYTSIRQASETLHISVNTITRHIRNRVPYLGMEFFYRTSDPYSARAEQPQAEISPEDDLPVVSFFKLDRSPLARYKSVTFLHKCIGRSIKQILEWLKGGHCTDPDCYYKYEKDCSQLEIELLKRNRYVNE